MHPTILVKRKADAVAKLTYAAERLAEAWGIDQALIAGLHPVGIHDNQLREMMLLEGAANLIQAVAIQAGAIEEGVSVSTETLEPEEAHWVESKDETARAEADFLSPETAELPAEVKEAADAVQPEAKPSKKRTSKTTTRKSAKK